MSRSTEPPRFTWTELVDALVQLAESPRQVDLAISCVQGLANAGTRVGRLEMVEMILTLAHMVQTDDPETLLADAEAFGEGVALLN